jgi:hypothetical protein
MSLKEWKNKELFENLMGKWGIKTNILNEKKEFPDLTGDGKVTQADILKGRGVELDEGEHEEKKYGVFSVTPDIMRKYLEYKGKSSEGLEGEELERKYLAALPKTGIAQPEMEFQKKHIKESEQLNEAEHKCPECECKGEECKCPKNKQLNEVLGVLAMTGLAAAVVAGIGAMAGINQDQTEKLEAFLAEDEQAGLTQKLALLDFMGDKKEHARLTRAILNSDKFRKYQKVDEVSVAAGVQGAPMPAKKDLKESINSILKENKEMIKRILK